MADNMVQTELDTDIDYVQNTAFSFPAKPDISPPNHTSHIPRRAASLHLNPSTPQRFESLERRSASTLPTFSFNASDVSGRNDCSFSANEHIDMAIPSCASLRAMGHRRGASELIGKSGLVSTSPAHPFDATPIIFSSSAQGSPVKRKGHAHKRSTAMSMHDAHTILQPRDANIMPNSDLAMSQLSTPKTGIQDVQEVAADSISASPAVPLARPRVGFARNIEIIPRPLSTISSEAESIHSQTAAATTTTIISSTTSNATPLPKSPSFTLPTRRRNRSARSSLSEVESAVEQSSDNDSRRSSREKSLRPLITDFARHSSDSTSSRPTPSFRDLTFPVLRPRCNLDRRSSEPTLAFTNMQQPRRSSVSLREPMTSGNVQRIDSKAGTITRKSSASRVMAWASVFIGRKDKKVIRTNSATSAVGVQSTYADDATPASQKDLDELFSQDPVNPANDVSHDDTGPSARIDLGSLEDFNPNWGSSVDTDPVIDLDAVLGPHKTPSKEGKSPGFGSRRQLHSSRTNRDFSSPSNLYHRRAESAPVLAPFDYSATASPAHSPMADVFEEDEEDETIRSARNSTIIPKSAFAFPIESMTVNNNHYLAPPTPSSDRARSFDSRDDVLEVAMPVDIVFSGDGARASMLTKDSDSSETPTLLADHGLYTSHQPPMLTTSPYSGSVTSAIDMSVRTTSFETPRMGTSASSGTDCKTASSIASGTPLDMRMSVDDVPSLTSSRSTMVSSSIYPSRRDVSEKIPSRTHAVTEDEVEKRRKKRTSIQSLAKLMSGPFSESRNKLATEHGNASSPELQRIVSSGRKRERRLSKLLFWRIKGTRLSGTRGV